MSVKPICIGNRGSPKSLKRYIVRSTLLVILLILPSALPSRARSAQSFDEYQLKAAFLFHLARFVGWPRAHASGSPIVIGILGIDPFGKYLDEMLMGEQIDQRPLEIKRYRKPQESIECDILYISLSESDRLGQVLERVQHRHILTVSDVKDFATYGGMVELLTDSDRVRLKINIEAAQGAQLTLSSKLLRSAQLIPAQPR